MEYTQKQYKEMLIQVVSKGKIVYYDDVQNRKIVDELSSDLEDFLFNQKRNDIEARLELKNIILD